MSVTGASTVLAVCGRILVAVGVLGLGGCWGGELARKDREVRASWAAVQASDRMAIDLADRLGTVWRRSPESKGTHFRFADFRHLNRDVLFDLGDDRKLARYGADRAEILNQLREAVIMLASPQSANLAWRLRGLRDACNAALLRSDGALRAYNRAARAYNKALDQSGHKVSKALLFPGRRQFALLSEQ